MYRSESWQSWPKSASQENIADYVNDTENYEIIDSDKELFVNMQHSTSRAPSEYADKRYFKADMNSQMSTEAQMIAATSHVHINRRTKMNSPRLKDSHSVKDQKPTIMDHRVSPRFPSQTNSQSQYSRNNYESESKTRELFVEQCQGPPVDRKLKPEKFHQGKASSSINTNSGKGRATPECPNKKERQVTIQSSIVPAEQFAEEEDVDTTSASREIIDVHHLKDFIKQQPEQYDPTQMPYTDNFRNKQTGEDTASQTIPEWRNVSGEERKTQVTDLKMKWGAVKEDLESQLKAQKTEKQFAPLNEIKVSERYLSALSNRNNSDSDVDGTKGTEEEIVLNENFEISSVHHVKMSTPQKMSENVRRKTKVHVEPKENSGRSRRQHVIGTFTQKAPEYMSKKAKEQLENIEDAGTATRQDAKDHSTHKVSECIIIQTEEKVEQMGDSMTSTRQHAATTVSQKISNYVPKKTTATNKISKYLPKISEGQEEHKEGAGVCTQEASPVTATQLISEPTPLYKQEEEQGYETVINLLQDLLSKQESVQPQEEHITFLMSLAPYIKHVPESQQLSMRISVMNTIISFIPSLSDSYHSVTTTVSPFIDGYQQHIAATHPSKTL